MLQLHFALKVMLELPCPLFECESEADRILGTGIWWMTYGLSTNSSTTVTLDGTTHNVSLYTGMGHAQAVLWGQNNLSSDQVHTVVVNNPFGSLINVDAFVYEPILAFYDRICLNPLQSRAIRGSPCEYLIAKGRGGKQHQLKKGRHQCGSNCSAYYLCLRRGDVIRLLDLLHPPLSRLDERE